MVVAQFGKQARRRSSSSVLMFASYRALYSRGEPGMSVGCATTAFVAVTEERNKSIAATSAEIEGRLEEGSNV